MLNAPDSPSSFCWPPKTNSPDVVSWRNTDHLKYDFAPLKNPNRWISPTLQREFDEARTAEFIGLAKKLTRSTIKKPAPVCDITHIRAFNDSFKKQTEPDIDYKNRNVVADRIIEKKETYSQMAAKTGYSVKNLRKLAHNRIRYGTNFDKPGRSKVIDSVSEANMMKQFNHITDLKQLQSPESKKYMRVIFKSEVEATYRRRYPQSVAKIKKPSSKTVDKYCKVFYNTLYHNIMKSSN